MRRVLVAVVLVGCAPQLRPPAPEPPAQRVAAPALIRPSVSPPAPRARAAAEQPEVVEEPGFDEWTSDPVRCPAPYAGQDGWVPQAEVSPEQARAMNERFGLICSERTLVTPGDPWIREELWPREKRIGCTDGHGRVVIPFVYLELRPFAASGVALALQPDVGWVYIDRRHRRIGKAQTLDNRPDEVFGGYARFQAENGKVGFLDRERRIAIPAKYDAAYPFNNCKAVVCVGCHPLRWSEDAPAEAACTGDLFQIDESGKRLQSLDGPEWEECAERRDAP